MSAGSSACSNVSSPSIPRIRRAGRPKLRRCSLPNSTLSASPQRSGRSRRTARIHRAARQRRRPLLCLQLAHGHRSGRRRMDQRSAPPHGARREAVRARRLRRQGADRGHGRGRAPAWRRSAIAWRGALVLALVADEEIDGGGSRALVKQQPTADLVIVGEPTNNAVFAAHKGCLRPLIRAKGKAAHSGRPELGVNAILAAGHLMTLFDERDRELRTRTHPLVGHASLTVTRIAGGTGDNVVPDNCETGSRSAPASWRISRRGVGRTARPADAGEARVWRRAELAAVRQRPGRRNRDRRSAGTGGGRRFPRAWGEVSPARRTDRWLRPCAFRDAGVVGIVLGPGSLDVAHQPDEYVPTDDLVQRGASSIATSPVAMMRR